MLLFVLPDGLRPSVSQRLQMVPEVAGQGRDHAPALQLGLMDMDKDVACDLEAEAGQARAPEQDMLGCVRLLLAYGAPRRWAPRIGAPRAPWAGPRREAADPVEVLARNAAVSRTELVNVHRQASAHAGDCGRHPVSPDSLEERIWHCPVPCRCSTSCSGAHNTALHTIRASVCNAEHVLMPPKFSYLSPIQLLGR